MVLLLGSAAGENPAEPQTRAFRCFAWVTGDRNVSAASHVAP